jgi:molybdenum cofactor biosynthesis protein B
MGYETHQEASGGRPVSCAVITVSDSRTVETDTSGTFITEALRQAGHSVCAYEIIRDEPTDIRSRLEALSADDECHAIVFNGGTGISKRDTTFDIVSAFLDKTLPGFGEIFRYLSYEEIGSGAIMSRATAGVAQGTIVFSIPGSTNAVRLATQKLILPELSHLVWEVAR